MQLRLGLWRCCTSHRALAHALARPFAQEGAPRARQQVGNRPVCRWPQSTKKRIRGTEEFELVAQDAAIIRHDVGDEGGHERDQCAPVLHSGSYRGLALYRRIAGDERRP